MDQISKRIRFNDAVNDFISAEASLSKTAMLRTTLLVARFEIILRKTFPFAILSMSGAIASAIVFTAFAPIASRQSTISSEMTIWPRAVSITLTSRSFAPPPTETSFRILVVCLFEQTLFACENIHPRPVWVFDPDSLYLSDHHWSRITCLESTVFAGHLCSVACGSDNRWLLNRHRDQVYSSC